jgi:hypothetical protein
MRPSLPCPPGPSVRRLGLLASAGLVLMLLALVCPGEQSPAAPKRPTSEGVIQKARNPERLILLVDSRRVHGWVSGTRNHAGRQVLVMVEGQAHDWVPVQADNTFSWSCKVNRPTRALFVLGSLKEKVELRPPSPLPPSVFFVVDRSAYRPGQSLRFAGFLRELDTRGEFVPLPRRPVEVVLRDDRKKTAIARLKLTSDQQGRIVGQHAFTSADPLGSYTLSIHGYRGAAVVTLAEYRKSKVQLAISGKRAGSQMELHFRAQDFLGAPVKGGKVSFTAQVVRNAERPASSSLDSRDFAHAENNPPPLRMEDVDAEAALIAQAEESPAPILGLAGTPQIVAPPIKGKVELGPQSASGVHHVNLKREWLDGHHAILVQGALIDGNGREERRTQSIPLDGNEAALRLDLARTSFVPGEPVRVTLRTSDPKGLPGRASVAVLRMTPLPVPFAPPVYYGFSMSGFQGFGNLGQPGFTGFGGMQGIGTFQGASPPIGMMGTIPYPAYQTVRYSLATAAPCRGDTATLRLDEPGAYKLVAVVVRPDGSKWRQETGFVVESSTRLPALNLSLDRTTFAPGDTLTGKIRSRFLDAQVLLSVRDSTGVRLLVPLRLKNGVADVKQTLPAGLRYGCRVEVQYADEPQSGGPLHVASRLIHVEPTDRMLTITSKIKPECEPGEKAVLDLEVNRKEPVDLIVSVYDQALVGIAPDRTVDIRSFYLADERVEHNRAWEVLQRRLGNMTIEELVTRARERLGAAPAVREVHELQSLVNGWNVHTLQTLDVVALLHLAGMKARYISSAHSWGLPANSKNASKLTVAEFLEAERNGWRLHFALLNDTFVVGEYHRKDQPNPWTVQPAYASYHFALMGGGYPIGMMGLMMGMSGMGGMSGHMPFGMSGMGGMQGMMMGGKPSGGLGMMGMGGMMMGGFQGSPSVPAPPQYAPNFLVQLPAGNPPTVLAADRAQPGVQVRRDFSDSAYWNAVVRTDASGKARVEFKVPDSLTGWQVVVTAVSKDMHVGRHTTSFRTSRPIMINPLLPRLYTEGDRVEVSASVHNQTNAPQAVRVRLTAENGKILTDAEREVTLTPKGSATLSWKVQVGEAGFLPLLFTARSKDGSDASLKRLPVRRAGVEQIVTQSGFCKGDTVVTLPPGVSARGAVLEIHFAPSLAADLLDTLDYLVEYPYGCVEQTMSRFLPAIKVAQVLKAARLEHPKLEAKLPVCVQGGIRRLLELQQPDGGWGWNGNGQTHEMMTPYALFGLLEAEKAGYALDAEEAVRRGLERLRVFITAMGPGQAADRVFCTYVHGQRHEVPAEWWQFIADQLDRDNLSDYALALSLELAVQQKQKRLAEGLVARLRERAQQEGGWVWWRTASFSRWADDPFEVTAAALKALVAYDKNDPLIPGVLSYFAASKRGNRWNSTKDTAMIVYAMCDYLARQQIDPRGRPALTFRCNDGLATAVRFAGPTEGSRVVVPAEQLKAGANHLRFTEGTAGVMYRAVLRYWQGGRAVPANAHGLLVRRQFWLLDDKGRHVREVKSGDVVPHGAYLESLVSAEPAGQAGTELRYLLVENQRPTGCEVVPADDKRFDQNGSPCVLREDREALVAYHHEQAQGTVQDRCVLHVEHAGDFLVPPARAELMYRTEAHGHSGTFTLRVKEK